MRHHRFAILAALSLLYLGNVSEKMESSPPPELAPVAQVNKEEKLPFHVFRSAWQITVVRNIRRDYLVNKLGIGQELAREIVVLAEREASAHDLGVHRILAMIIVESYGDPDAVSYAGAIGLMQIIPATGRFVAYQRGEPWNGPRSLKDVETNISFGAWYYAYLLRQFGGNKHAALAAYNWGPQHIANRQKRGARLPQVYPGKVYAAEEDLYEELRHEYRTRFWRGFDSFINRARECLNTGRSPRECGLEWPFVPDGEGLLPRDGEGVLSADARLR